MSHDQKVYMSIELPKPGPTRLSVMEVDLSLEEEQIAYRVTFGIEGLELQPDNVIQVDLPELGVIQFRLRGSTDQERTNNQNSHSTCTMVCAAIATSEVREEFFRLWEDQSYLAATTIEYRSESFSIAEDGQWNVATYTLDPLATSTASFRTFRNECLENMTEAARKLIGWISWRCGAYSSPVLHLHSLYCTVNGTDWLLIPNALTSNQEEIPAVHIPKGISDELVSLKAKDLTEPLGHELQREAWGQLQVRPRSALLLGIAAAEVGFKQWVGRMAADASWLVEVGPSPPLQSMMADYLPLLVRRRLGLEFVNPVSKQAITKTIAKGVAARNIIAHSPPTNPKYQSTAKLLSYERINDLQELLLAVADFLWILDYLWLQSVDTNLQWPLDRVRPETRETWTLVLCS